MNSYLERIKRLPKEYVLFLGACVFIGFAQSFMDSTFNNFVKDAFSINSSQRAILELPREIPGLMVAFVSAFLFFMGSRRLAFVAMLLCSAGILLIGYFAKTFPMMLMWLFIYSLGQHLFIPLSSSIPMNLAKQGQDGKRLGEVGGLMNLAAIGGGLMVIVGFKYLKFNFSTSYLIAGISFAVGSILLLLMKADKPVPTHARLKLKREYKLYYWLAVLFGTRKQLFLTFAPWVIVKVFDQKVEMVAFLFTLGLAICIIFRPLLGRAIDRFGERAVLMTEAATLVIVCLGYGFSLFLFPKNIAMMITFACYVADQLLMAFGMARATYLKKVAVSPDDITPTLGIGTSIDHVFSISIALISGLVWAFFGFQFVFLIGACIAAVNFFSAMRIRFAKAAPAAEQ